MNTGRLILIDALSCLYRFFYAIRGLTSSGGVPTNAVFGLLRFLEQISSDWTPSHLAVVFDGGIPKERLELLPSYKANRPPMPPELRSQLPLAEELLQYLGIQSIRMDGEEADDVLASMAKAVSGDVEVLLATADKDMLQLVDGRISILSPAGGRIDREGVQKKVGVTPEQIVDWLALQGDNSDNIPGVPGVGEKTAVKLLEKFGSVQALYAKLQDVEKERIRLALQQSRDVVDRNLRLVRLRLDLKLPLTLEEVHVGKPDKEKLDAFLVRYGFSSHLRKLRNGEALLGAPAVREPVMVQQTLF